MDKERTLAGIRKRAETLFDPLNPRRRDATGYRPEYLTSGDVVVYKPREDGREGETAHVVRLSPDGNHTCREVVFTQEAPDKMYAGAACKGIVEGECKHILAVIKLVKERGHEVAA